MAPKKAVKNKKSVKKPDDEAFTSLRHILQGREDGDQEFERLLSILIRSAEGLHPSGEFALTRLGSGLWQANETIYAAWFPCQPDWKIRETVLGDYAALLEGQGLSSCRRIVAIIPDRVPGEITTRSDLDQGLAVLRAKVPTAEVAPLWDGRELQDRILNVPALGLHYFPKLSPDGSERLAKIARTRSQYQEEITKLYGKIQFIGMSVYKEEATAQVALDRIYIPLRVVPEADTNRGREDSGTNPLKLISPGSRNVVLGDPGSGKSTLLRFLALAGTQTALQARYGSREDDRLPVLVTLRRYADELKANEQRPLFDHLLDATKADFDIPNIDRDFFEYYLLNGRSILLFDGVDELPGDTFKSRVRQRVSEFLETYPGNTALVTSRIVGYDASTRFDALGFSHHRLAPLQTNEIEGFVRDWYAARIENKKERQRHASDLERVLGEEHSQALRELAKNPLLLTIICLVHRIDAVLPDERVVLYQKCAETLLNSWPALKIQAEGQRYRNKVERRNRARMEAIAYWMHCMVEEQEEASRSVVRAEDLQTFLTKFITQVEKPRTGKPEEMAEEFLCFVKQTAGLLIEVGSGLYSFVHLTFQEYLTATHLRKTGEAGGVPVIWGFIEERCRDPRWHEVVRLLLGSFERTESQEYLLERILPKPEEADALERSLLAGGCLLDRVDAAEEMEDEILDSLVDSTIRAESVEELRRPLQLLASYQDREASAKRHLARSFGRYIRKRNSDTAQTASALSLICLGWSDSEVLQVTDLLNRPEGRAGQLFLSFGLGDDGNTKSDLDREEIELLRCGRIALNVDSPEGTWVAAVMAALVAWQPSTATKKTLMFTELLASCEMPSGPFLYQFGQHILLNQGLGRRQVLDSSRALDRASDRARALELALDRARALTLELALGRTRAMALELALNQALDREMALTLELARHRALDRELALALDREMAPDPAKDRARELARHRALDRIEEQGQAAPKMLEDPDLYTPVLNLLTDLLDLKPRPHWWEVLRKRGISRVPSRIPLTDPELWHQTETRFAQGKATETDAVNAACQLLFDIWLWLTECYQSPPQSPFALLAKLTQDSTSPPLRIAHCLRDITFGDETRIEDLRNMVNSQDAAYRKIFEDAFWIDRQEDSQLTPD